MRPLRLVALLVALALVTLAPPGPVSAAVTVEIEGGGWGHGIGMSQYGAYGRAKRGDSATEIIKHYYSGVEVTKVSFDREVRVGMTHGRSSISLSSTAVSSGGGRVEFKVAGASKTLAGGGPGTSWRVEPSSTGRMRLYRNGNRVERDGRSLFGSPTKPLIAVYEPFDTSVLIEGKAYRVRQGRLLFQTYDACTGSTCYVLRSVLTIPMQKYLYGLGEVPSSWPGAALRAQVMTGRTYAYSKLRAAPGGRYPCGCHLYDTPIDQVYAGDSKRTASGPYWDDWKAAVDDTAGLVVLYDGAPAQTLYSSSSGGHTEHNENVWGGSPVPYLRGVPDGPDDNAANPNHTWRLTMSPADLGAKLNAAYGIGTFKKIELVPPFGVSGRVTVVKADGGGVKIVGSTKTVRVSGWSLRSALALKDTLFRIRIAYEVGERFKAKYGRLDGAPGEPTGEPYDVPRGWAQRRGVAQDFTKGRMTWNAALDRVVWHYGPVLEKYDRLGREGSPLGMPRRGITGDGFAKGRYMNGVIVNSSQGAFGVWARFWEAYRTNGGVAGPLGFPTSGQRESSNLPNGGRRQRFVHGSVYLNPNKHVAFALWDPFEDRYRKMNEASGRCGYPISHVIDGAIPRVEFQHGTMEKTATGITVNCG